MNANEPQQRQPFAYHVCRKDIGEEPLDELVQRPRKIDARGTLPEQNEDSSLDQLAMQKWKTQSFTTVKDIRMDILGNS